MPELALLQRLLVPYLPCLRAAGAGRIVDNKTLPPQTPRHSVLHRRHYLCLDSPTNTNTIRLLSPTFDFTSARSIRRRQPAARNLLVLSHLYLAHPALCPGERAVVPVSRDATHSNSIYRLAHLSAGRKVIRRFNTLLDRPLFHRCLRSLVSKGKVVVSQRQLTSYTVISRTLEEKRVEIC